LSLLGWVLEAGQGGDVSVSLADTGGGLEILVERAGWRDLPTDESEPSRLRLARRLLQLQGGWLELNRLNAGAIQMRVMLPSVQGPTILVVDDNPDVLRLFQRFIQSPDVHLVQATSAESALKHLAESRPRLITLDLMMPVRDGWDLLQVLARDPAARTIPVAVCSVIHERSLALAMGASYFLPKPVSQAALLDVLEKCGLGSMDRV
jgi:CheY-like chemotaxis protein